MDAPQPASEFIVDNRRWMTFAGAITETDVESTPPQPGFRRPADLLALPGHAMMRTLQLGEWIRNQFRDLMQRASKTVLNRIGRDSWVNVRHDLLTTLSEVVSRILARGRQLLGIVLPQDRFGLRHVYEGLEDRAILAGLISAIVTLALLVRYRRRAAERELIELHSTLPGVDALPLTTWWWWMPAIWSNNSGMNR